MHGIMYFDPPVLLLAFYLVPLPLIAQLNDLAGPPLPAESPAFAITTLLSDPVMPQSLRRSARIESIRQFTRTDTKFPGPPSSLMSIPPELRLRIFGYLVNGGRAIDPDSAGHTCIHTGNGTRFYLLRRRLKCPCTELVWPQILAVNKQLFAEAMPALYSTTEFHVCLPANRTFESAKNQPAAVVRKLPRYAYPHVKRMALIGCLDDISGLTSRDEGTGCISRHLSSLESAGAKPRNVCICIGIQWAYDQFGFHLRAEELLDVVGLSGLKDVQLEVPCIIPGMVMAIAPGVVEASPLGTEIREQLMAALDARVRAFARDVNMEDISNGVWRPAPYVENLN